MRHHLAFFVSVLIFIATIGGAALGLPSWAQTQAPTAQEAVKLPPEHIPTYFLVTSYLRVRAYSHLTGNHFHRVLHTLEIPNDSPLKDRLTQLVVLTHERFEKKLDLSHIRDGDTDAWNDAQDAFLEEHVRVIKNLYDTFLNEAEAAGHDRDKIHSTIIEEGRKLGGVALIGELRDKQIDILNLFEDPDNDNPWLRKED